MFRKKGYLDWEITAFVAKLQRVENFLDAVDFFIFRKCY